MTPADEQPARAPFRCRRCGGTLGERTPQGLAVGDVLLRLPVLLECRRCGSRRTWRPPAKRDEEGA